MANDATNVRVAGTGKIWYAPIGTALPTDTTTALDAAFVDVGYVSEEGLTIDPEESTSDIRAWGGDLVRRVISEFGLTASFTLIETNAAVVGAYWGSGSGAAWEAKQIEVRKSWVFHITDGAKINRIVFPDASVTDRGAVTYATSEEVGWPLTLSTYPNAAGTHAFYYAS